MEVIWDKEEDTCSAFWGRLWQPGKMAEAQYHYDSVITSDTYTAGLNQCRHTAASTSHL